MSLGMTMSQLTNVIKYRPNRELWHSVAAVGSSRTITGGRKKKAFPMWEKHPLIWWRIWNIW